MAMESTTGLHMVIIIKDNTRKIIGMVKEHIIIVNKIINQVYGKLGSSINK